MNVSSWGDDEEENWEDAPTAPATSTTAPVSDMAASGGTLSVVDYAMVASSKSNIISTNQNINIQEDWSEDWSGTVRDIILYGLAISLTKLVLHFVPLLSF